MGTRNRFLQVMNRTVNRATLRAARNGSGMFSLLRHTGRKSGKTYETPLVLARVPEGFVAELTYGENVDWLRNITAAGRATVIFGGRPYEITAIEPYASDAGLRAYGGGRALVLKALRKRDFRLLRSEPAEGSRIGPGSAAMM